jgi:hypothetical protein
MSFKIIHHRVSAKEESNFIIYPNPITKVLTIKQTNMDNPNAKFKIYTISKLVLQGKMENGTINLESLKKGIYLIKVEGEEMTYLFNDW